MSREVMQQALDALCKSFPTAGKYEDELEAKHREAIEALRAELAKPEYPPGMIISTECNHLPAAPHGFDRNGSHNTGRYVCLCESWQPGEAS